MDLPAYITAARHAAFRSASAPHRRAAAAVGPHPGWYCVYFSDRPGTGWGRIFVTDETAVALLASVVAGHCPPGVLADRLEEVGGFQADRVCAVLRLPDLEPA